MKIYEVDAIRIDGSLTAYPITMMKGPFVDVKKVLRKQFNQDSSFKIRCRSIHLHYTCTDEVEINKISEGLFEITVKE